jgi:hypothetical protein
MSACTLVDEPFGFVVEVVVVVVAVVVVAGDAEEVFVRVLLLLRFVVVSGVDGVAL